MSELLDQVMHRLVGAGAIGRGGTLIKAKECHPLWSEIDELGAYKKAFEELKATLDGPELHDFATAVVKEAAFQRAEWGVDHDGGKTASDWFWLLGYLGGKALYSYLAGDKDKALHHVITTAAACANWHAAISGTSTRMRPGIEPPSVP